MTHGAVLLPGSEDTIVAIATAHGRGALAAIRISGPRARAVAAALGAHVVLADSYVPRTALRVQLTHPESGALLDDALATLFVAPNSFTGEDVLELSVHGGLTVPHAVLAACIAAACRLALPGEFTRRAVMAGRMDFVQAEAVADLIDARTVAMSRQALAQLDGGLSRRIDALREEVIGLEALIAYDIDFPEEDDGPISAQRIGDASDRLVASLDALLATAPRAAMLRDGALVVIAGPPNAGKSSLFNALLGERRAIVTVHAGTTRDAIEGLLDRDPTPLRLVDTAGLRETSDPIELLGIEVSTRYLQHAAVVLACGATDRDVVDTAAAIAPHTTGIIVRVRTKSDVVSDDARDESRPASRDGARDDACDEARDADYDMTPDENAPAEMLSVSAERGDGLHALLGHVDRVLLAHSMSDRHGETMPEAPMVTRERHRLALQTARDEVAMFLDAWRGEELPAPVAAVHLLAAREALGSVTGVILLDDVLDRVFRDFCIGK